MRTAPTARNRPTGASDRVHVEAGSVRSATHRVNPQKIAFPKIWSMARRESYARRWRS